MTSEGLRFGERWFDMSSDLRVAVLSFLIVMVLTRLILKRSLLGKCHKEIPEPPAWPVIGHLHLVGKCAHQSLMKLAREYGPLMSIRIGGLRAIVATSPEMAEEFLKTQDGVWASRPSLACGEIFFYNNNSGVLGPLNDVWRKHRRVYTSEFLSPANMENQKDQRHESVMRMVNSLLATERANVPVEVYKIVGDMNTYLMAKLLFGKRCSVYDKICSSTGEMKDVSDLIHDLAHSNFLTLGELFPYLKWLDLDGNIRKLKQLHSDFDAYLNEQIEKYRRQLLDGEEDNDSGSLLRTLLSMLDKKDPSGWSYKNIKGALTDMIAGGIETTATAVSFTIAELMRNPEAKKKLVKELDDVVGRGRLVNESDIPRLKYLKMVVKESLRLHPALPLLICHQSIAPTVVAGFHIPANTLLFVNAYAIQRDPDLWEDSLAFKPERFLDSSIDVTGQHFQLLPFGSGRRMCAGMKLGLATVEIVVAQLCHTLDIQLPRGLEPEDVDMTEKGGMATGLANPFEVVFSPRLPLELYSQ